jgi:hypothetical protein
MNEQLLPHVAKLAASSRKSDRHLAARVHHLVGDVHDLNGAPLAAMASYQRALALHPRRARSWGAIACMLENMGELGRARAACRRALKLAPGEVVLAADLERMEWATFHPYPVLYERGNRRWAVSEALATDRLRRALGLVGTGKSNAECQLRAQVFGALGDAGAVIHEWQTIARGRGRVELGRADWFYSFQGRAGGEPALWRLLLWIIRPRLAGGAFPYSPSLWNIDVSDQKRFELYARLELAKSEGDVAALLALAGRYPRWREPGEMALRLGHEHRPRAARARG